jgi:hypothetical protein
MRRLHPRSGFCATLGASLVAMLVVSCGSGGGGEAPPPASPTSQPPPTEINEPQSSDDSAILEILSRDPTDIKIDGKKVGTTPISGLKVRPGSHDVTFVFSEDNAPTLTVEVAAGDARTVKLDPPPPIQEPGKGEKKDDPKKKP